MSQTILIIDHKPGPIRRARSVLERAGFRVEVARDGAAGLSAFRRLSPELTLIGEALPDRKGPTVCKELRSCAPGDSAPILMIGCHREQDRDQLGCDEYLITPVGDDELLEAVRRHLREDDADRPAKTVSGDLEHLNIAEIVQTLSLGMKTACITLKSSDLRGKIWFEKGKVHHAATGDLEGENAFFEMMTWVSGEFSIENGATYPDRSIERDTMFLVMEGLRRIDEAREAASQSSKDQPDVADVADVADALSELDQLDQLDQGATIEPTEEPDTSESASTCTTEPTDKITDNDETNPHEQREEAATAEIPSNETESKPEPVVGPPKRPVPPVTLPGPPARSSGSRSSWIWAAAAVCVALLGFGIHTATKTLLTSESTTTVPIPIRIGPVPESGDRGPELVAAADVDEIWAGYDLVEYPESPTAGPEVEEAHTEWELLEKTDDAPAMSEPVETTVDAAPEASNAERESGALSDSAPDTETADTPAAEVASEVVVEDPPRTDYSLGLAAADAILAQMADPEETEPDPVPVDSSSIDLFVTSSVKEGTLTVLVDDSEMLTRELASPRRSRESFDTSLAITSGEHRVVARLDLTAEGYSFEKSVVVKVEAGETVELELSARATGRRPIVLTLR